MAILALLTFFFSIYTLYRRKAQKKLAAANQKLEEGNIKLSTLNTQLSTLNEELTTANARAEESSQMKTNFIQQISHEIRTPLNILSGFTQIVTTPGMDLDDTTKSDINRQITENTDRITELVNKMLELSDASSQTVITKDDRASAMQIAMQAIEESGISHAAHLDFTFSGIDEAEDSLFLTNLHVAVRALTMLLDNARKFTRTADAIHRGEMPKEKAKVVLTVVASPHEVKYIVEDNGIGIPPSEAEHIFGEFVQLDEYYEGTGIGLAVARNTIRRLGGDILLDTTSTAFTRFVMILTV
jgi:signal transduction histidine kinase